ncbi:SRPBCC domain-containing protein [Carbonactinospora thermoautotrophica]|uniref:SRPBCC domain-containing protein n=1 Tax=Carbonactinospora thermoautotrophica TaxID=1469144 RepID=UPI00099F0635|nr:SRPBCC domain-containing protein [Carbonactinospora thermoautotrophica]
MAGEREIVVPVPAGVAWRFLTDLGAVASCLPGVTLDTVEPDQVAGRCRTRLGGSTITYRGSLRVTTADPAAHAAVLEATGAEARGDGKVRITAEVRVEEIGAVEGTPGETRIRLRVTGDATGRALAFGPEVLGVSATRLLDRFVKNVRDRITTLPIEEPARAPAPTGAPASAAPGAADEPPEEPRPAVAERLPAAEASAAPADGAADPDEGNDPARAGRTGSTVGAPPAGEAREPHGSRILDGARAAARKAQDAVAGSTVAADSGPAETRAPDDAAHYRPFAPVEPLDLFGPTEPSRFNRVLKLVTLITVAGVAWRCLRRLFRRRA